MFCNYCRAPNPDDAVYCRTCGRTIRFSADAPAMENTELSAVIASPPVAPFMLPATDHAVGTDAASSESTSQPDHSGITEVVSNGTDTAVAETDSLPSNLNSSTMPTIYGTLGQRFTAYFADLIVVYLLVFLVYLASGVVQHPLPEGDATLLTFACLFLYMIAAQTTYHTTLGKYIHGLEVRSEQPTRQYPAFWRILVRETIGRVLASLFWGAGYWFTNRKPKKQAWSDEIAGTIVTVRSTNKILVRAFTAFVLIALVADIGAIGYGQYKEDRDKQYATLQNEMQSTSNDVATARQTVDQQLNGTKPVNDASDFITWQNGMKSLIQDLDQYEAQIDRMQALIQQGISENLAASDAERTQLIVLKQVYDIRKNQAEKLRHEADLVINSDYSSASMASLRNNLQLLDSDIDALENQASQLLAQIGEK